MKQLLISLAVLGRDAALALLCAPSRLDPWREATVDGAEQLNAFEEENECLYAADDVTARFSPDLAEALSRPCATDDEPYEPLLSWPEPVLSCTQAERLSGWTESEGRCIYCGKTKEYAARSGGCVGPLCPHVPASSGMAGSSPEAVRSTPPDPASGPREAWLNGYRSAVDLLEAKAAADRRFAASFPTDHSADLIAGAEWGEDMARYMRAIEPKDVPK